MPPTAHSLGHCTCRSHVDRPWNRPEHWTSAEVEYLCTWFGLRSDATIARRLGRSVVGIRLKAKRLRLKKKDAGYTARELGRQLGVDATTIVDRWIRRGLLRSTRSYPVGLNRVQLVQHSEVERFIAEHGEQIDHTKVPADSVFAAQVAANRWYSLPQLHRLTGRMNLGTELLAGRLVGRKKSDDPGSHWMVPDSEIPKIRRLPPAHAAESLFRREQVLRVRRERRRRQAEAVAS
ncbi:MAG TPA: hypothetical protein VEW95_09300 [Candidatus Limnocylindrales bacterium]|nr:hypothetical protein [Candidatus Limnocylindrales bacterium]